jgi:hypothetical protein
MRNWLFAVQMPFLCIMLSLCNIASLTAEPPPENDRRIAYLGLVVDNIDPALASHLPEMLIKEQGVVVRDVKVDSAAAKGGLMENDIVTTYDDQRLFCQEQLRKLVRNDKAGRELVLGVFRNGRFAKLKCTLQDCAISAQFDAKRWAINGSPYFELRLPLERNKKSPADARVVNWDDTEALAISHAEGNQFRVSVQLRDNNGKIQLHEFGGTRGEIQQQIKATDALTIAERSECVRSLDQRSLHMALLVFPRKFDDDF